MHKSSVIGLGIVSLFLGAACTIVTKTDTADQASTKDAGASTDSGSATSATDGGAATAGTGKTGSILLAQQSFTVGETTIVSYSATATFSEASAAGAGGGAACKTSAFGDCSLIECDLSGAAGGEGGDAGAAKKAPHAGDITVTGDEEVVLAADPDTGLYVAKSGQKALFTGGADIGVKASGDTVPAFDKTLKAPATITLTAPELPAAPGKLTIPRADALELTWTDGTEGNVTASISTLSADNKKTASIACTFVANKGAGTIPAAALAKLIATENGAFSVGASSASAFKAGDYSVTVLANAAAASGLAKIE